MNLISIIIGRFKRILRPNDEHFRHKLYVFFFCLLISIFLWLLIALSKETVSTIEYPIKFVNIPNNLAIVNHPDSTISIRITSAGFELFSVKYLMRHKPVFFDLSNINIEKKDGFFIANLPTSGISADLMKKYKLSDAFLSASPEYIYFRFEELKSKKVPVVANLKLNFEKQFRLSDSIRLEPDSVTIIGLEQVLDSVHQVLTEEKVINGIAGPESVSVGVKLPNIKSKLRVDPREIVVKFNADKYTEASIDIPVESVDPSINIKPFPASVKVSYLVSLKNYKRIDDNMFRAVIDPSGEGGNAKAKVMLSVKPSFVEVISIVPEEVEYLVLRND